MITAASMAASTMVAVDITIANVALPHMQATMSASQDQIVWVLTSYLVAGAIATPLTGWLASRYGRKPMMLISVAGFSIASFLCGIANNLEMIVFARLLQGAFGAGVVPLSQATLLDINPPHRHAKAMAIFALGSMLGPLLGPTLGGWLTDSLSWRWVFFINLPFGLLSFVLMSAFMYDSRDAHPGRFDLFGFAWLAIGLAAFQLMLDRGEQQDWFESTEIWIYAVVLALSVWSTVVHIATARNTFIRPELFKDRNFAIGCIIAASVGVVAFATIPLIVVMQQNLLGYSALHTGVVGVSRGIGTVAAILLVTRLANRFDARIFLGLGLAVTAISSLMYARTDLYVDDWTLIVIGLVQGMGGGFMFLPLSLIVFSTLPGALRNEGAAMFALTRNIGNSVGISYLQRQLVHHTAWSQSRLVEAVRPDNPMFAYARPDFDWDSGQAMARMSGEIARQAAMVGNVEVFWMVFFAGMAMLPLLLFMRDAGDKSGRETLPPIE